MEEEIHRENCYKRSKKCRRERENYKGNHPHNGTKKYKSDNPSLNQLLNIPAFGNIIILGIFKVSSINWTILEFYNITVSRTSSSESLSHRMFAKSFDSCHSSVKMSSRRAGSENNLINSTLVPNIKKSRKYREKQDYIHTFFFILSPDIFQRKEHECQASNNKANEGTPRIREKHESKKYQYPESYEVVIGFFRSEKVDKEAYIDKYKKSGRIRAIKYPLESLHSCTVYPMVNWRSSSKAPVAEMW